MDSDHQPQLKGVVIITLPPSDNPSLGKTITAFTLTDDGDQYPTLPHQTHQEEQPQLIQTQQEYHHPIQPLPPQGPQNHFPLSRFNLGTPRKLRAFVGITLFVFLVYGSVFSSTLQELKGSDDDRETKSFIFPLYHKSGIREIPQNDLQQKLGRLIYKENLVVPVDDVIVSHKISKLASSDAAAIDSSAILPVRGNVFPDGLYFTSVLVGSPPRQYYLDIDTGSDLAWIQCDAPCTSCAKGANSLYKPRRGHIVHPKDSLCMEIQRNHKAEYCEACEQCDYEIEYADHSSSIGVLAKDELHLMIANGSLINMKFIFGYIPSFFPLYFPIPGH
uniref:Peptidase A1 domain-containing protein n=1 Tax=Rhizophora mucronata TaxID=61149 RepID=A0A2P2JH68_RHIMU